MKTAKNDPLVPVRADYRIIKKILEAMYKVVHLPEEYDLIVRVFDRAEGSWEGVFDGDIDQVRLLKKIIKIAYKNGYLTKTPSWD